MRWVWFKTPAHNHSRIIGLRRSFIRALVSHRCAPFCHADSRSARYLPHSSCSTHQPDLIQMRFIEFERIYNKDHLTFDRRNEGILYQYGGRLVKFISSPHHKLTSESYCLLVQMNHPHLRCLHTALDARFSRQTNGLGTLKRSTARSGRDQRIRTARDP